jgi:hypothetical protein
MMIWDKGESIAAKSIDGQLLTRVMEGESCGRCCRGDGGRSAKVVLIGREFVDGSVCSFEVWLRRKRLFRGNKKSNECMTIDYIAQSRKQDVHEDCLPTFDPSPKHCSRLLRRHSSLRKSNDQDASHFLASFINITPPPPQQQNPKDAEHHQT